MIIGIGFILFNAKNLASVDDEISQGDLMSFTNILFSFRGRINRAKFWFYQVLILDMVILICVAVGAAISKDTGALAGYVIGCFLVVWPGLAIATKRSHDRNKSGAFILIALIPIIGIWYVVEVAFLKGTEGDNRYGSDPLMALNQNKNENTVNEN